MPDLTPQWLDNLLDPNNPFIPWLLLGNLVVVLLHVYLVYWVYRDAAWRYNRGAPWGLLAALLPVAGWMFYLMYRRSPLVELDRLDAELFDEVEHEWTDYDAYRRQKSQGWFKDLFVEEGGSYSPWVQLSRLREQRRKLTPEERADIRTLRRQRKLAAKQQRIDRIAAARESRRQRRRAAKERQTVVGAHGATMRLSDRRQRALQRRLAVMEQLKLLPREDNALEELIYEMRYDEALKQAREGLTVAAEMGDPQGKVTFEAYVERLERLVAEQRA